jgi:hypothetical protein
MLDALGPAPLSAGVRDGKCMRKWRPTIYGFAAGCVFGLYLLFNTSGGGIPVFISCWLGPLLDGISAALSSGERGPGGILFALLFVVCFWGAIGAGIGYVVGRLLRVLKKKKPNDAP